jgi:hypothetical protein
VFEFELRRYIHSILSLRKQWILTQSKAQTTGITDKQQKDLPGIATKKQQPKEKTEKKQPNNTDQP